MMYNLEPSSRNNNYDLYKTRSVEIHYYHNTHDLNETKALLCMHSL